MARIVLPIAGAIVGSFFGAPQLGWAIGAAIGNAVDPQIIKGPGIGDIAHQTSQEGGPRPFIYALSQPIAGNIISTTEPKIVKRRQSAGKGGPKTETESVYRTYAIGVCEGPILEFVRVWRNGTLVYDARNGDTPENAKFLENARFFTGSFDQDPSPDLEAIYGVGTTPSYRGTAYMVLADDDLTDFRGAIPQYMFQVSGSDDPVPIEDVVTDICDRANLQSTKIDVSSITGDVRGFTVTNLYPAYAALQSLSQIFLFDPSNRDGKIAFVPRGEATIATITEDDMLDDEQEIEQDKRGDPISVPRVLHLNYFDVAGGQTTDKQTSERAGDRRSVGESSVQSAVIMNANEAARIIAINHKIIVEDQKGELKFSLPDSFIELTTADTVIVQYQGKSVRCRITKCDIHDGYQEYMLLRDRQSAYTSNVEGIPASPQTPPPSGVIGPTLIQPLDIHILRDVDDNQGLAYYIAVSGIYQAWQGATVELSYDGGENYIDSASTTVQATMGELVTALPDHPAEYPDETNTFRVRIDTPLADLLETDITGLYNQTNLAIVGDELIQFATPEEVEEGVWDLSLLLRGRKGSSTEYHPEGSRFVLLERTSLNMIPAELVDIGRTLTFRATSFGTVPENGTVVNMVFTGRVQIERAAAYLMAHRSGSNMVVSWQGVGRLGAGVSATHGIQFEGYRVTFSDATTGDAIVVETSDTDLTQDVSVLDSPVTIRVEQLNHLTGPGPAIEVIIV